MKKAEDFVSQLLQKDLMGMDTDELHDNLHPLFQEAIDQHPKYVFVVWYGELVNKTLCAIYSKEEHAKDIAELRKADGRQDGANTWWVEKVHLLNDAI